jgi:hypothetical protein
MLTKNTISQTYCNVIYCNSIKYTELWIAYSANRKIYTFNTIMYSAFCVIDAVLSRIHIVIGM